MDHPSEIQLHRYLDRELSVEEQERIAAHLVTCATCRARVDAYAHLGALLRASLPDPAAFAPVGETWRSIAGRLQPRPSPRWPLLPLLPPFLLAAIGTVAQVALREAEAERLDPAPDHGHPHERRVRAGPGR